MSHNRFGINSNAATLLNRYSWPAFELAIFAAIVTFLTIQTSSLYGVIYDDAYITLRYARNLANGLGAVYNPGEYVEGYTNFLWMILLVPGVEDGVKGVFYAQSLGIIFHQLCAVPLYFILGALCRFRVSRIVGVSIFLILPCAYFNAMRGLETSLFNFLFLSVLAFYVIGIMPVLLGIAQALLAMTRPDAVIWVSVLFFLSIFFNCHNRKEIKRSFLAFSTILTVYLSWKLWYYGSIVPNTAYAKYGIYNAPLLFLETGYRYVSENLFNLLKMYWFIPCVLAFLISILLRKDWKALCFPILTIAQIFYVITAGGDTIGGFRFCVSVLCLALISTVIILDQILNNDPQKRWVRVFAGFGLVVGILVALLFGAASSAPYWLAGLFVISICLFIAALFLKRQKISSLAIASFGFVIAASYFYSTIDVMNSSQASEKRIVGRFVIGGIQLQELLPANCSVSTAAAGAIAYYFHGVVIDELGLTDSWIAHSPVNSTEFRKIGHMKGDANYILKRSPCVITFESNWFSGRPVEEMKTSWLPAQRALLTEKREELNALYEPITIPAQPVFPEMLTFYKRRDVVLRH